MESLEFGGEFFGTKHSPVCFDSSTTWQDNKWHSSFTEFWCSTMVCIYCFIRGIVKRCVNKEAQDQ